MFLQLIVTNFTLLDLQPVKSEDADAQVSKHGFFCFVFFFIKRNVYNYMFVDFRAGVDINVFSIAAISPGIIKCPYPLIPTDCKEKLVKLSGGNENGE